MANKFAVVSGTDILRQGPRASTMRTVARTLVTRRASAQNSANNKRILREGGPRYIAGMTVTGTVTGVLIGAIVTMVKEDRKYGARIAKGAAIGTGAGFVTGSALLGAAYAKA
jgi:hypothetical protein